ncbi:hypothetical protein CAL28_07490 [Bordetella genomosp. 11]|uniref:Uncharacterized protein n=1 Tax=Bordetella genomosp. 11 TaxID=1416808 RepID=A0A261US72_9BORD|nr:hypothetical protein CAL28_07490 [Bordetella genomosp. 11]
MPPITRMISRWVRLAGGEAEEGGAEAVARVPVGVDMMRRRKATEGATEKDRPKIGDGVELLYKI